MLYDAKQYIVVGGIGIMPSHSEQIANLIIQRKVWKQKVMREMIKHGHRSEKLCVGGEQERVVERHVTKLR